MTNNPKLGRVMFGEHWRKSKRQIAPGEDPHNELLNREFDQGNDDLDAIKSSLGVSDKRRPASE